MQNTMFLIFSKKTFKLLSCENGKCIKSDALFEPEESVALQHAAEDYLIEMLQNANLAANHASRIN